MGQSRLKRGPAIHKIIHDTPGFACENFKPHTEEREVRVMACSEGYAMVRRKGAMPYVAPIGQIFQPNVQAEPRRT
jgi:hypothetical protein